MRLTKRDYSAIKAYRKSGASLKEIAGKYLITPGRVSQICKKNKTRCSGELTRINKKGRK